jgi:hypothetical protein
MSIGPPNSNFVIKLNYKTEINKKVALEKCLLHFLLSNSLNIPVIGQFAEDSKLIIKSMILECKQWEHER